MKLPSALHVLLRPTVILPVLLAAALLAFAFKLGDLGGVLGHVRALPMWVLLAALLFTAVYITLKALQLRLMLINLNLSIPWSTFALAFAVGELCVTLPFGLFSQNWVMSASSRVRVGRSSAATVMMLLGEILVLLLALAAIGIPGWPAVRPVALLMVALIAALVLGVLRYEHVTTRIASGVRQPTLHKALLGGVEMLGSLRRLSRTHVLGLNLLLAAGYLGALICAFLVIGRGMGVEDLGYVRAITIYAFPLAVILLGGGLFGQIGTVEVLGMVTARQWGIDYTDGLALMLGFRVVWTGAMWLCNLPVVVLLWHFIPARAGAGPAADAASHKPAAPDSTAEDRQ